MTAALRPSGADAINASTETSAVRRWAVLGLLSLGAMIAFVDRTSISSALAVDAFKDHFQLSDVDRGWINSAFFWSYAACQIPMGWIVDRYGVKTPYTVCLVAWCLASAAIGLMSTVMGLIIMRLIVGAAEAVVVPASYRWIRSNFHPNDSGTAVGLYMLGAKFGPAFGAPLAAWMIVAFEWQAMFLLTGIVGLIWLVPWNLLARSDNPHGRVGRARPKAVRQVDIPMRTILTNPLIWGTLLVSFCYNYFTFFCMTWMPAYLVEQRGLSIQQMGLYTFYTFMGMALVALSGGWIADRLIHRFGHPVLIRKSFIVTGFLIACTVILGAQTDDVSVALFWNVASLSGLGLASANTLALCSLTLIPPSIIGRVKGIQNLAPAFAGIASPIMTGWLLEWTGSFDAPMTLIFILLIIGLLAVIFMLRADWAPKVPGDDGDAPLAGELPAKPRAG